jgi:hypothetical protein
MLLRVAFVWTGFSEDRIASVIRVIRIDELGTTLAVTSKRWTLRIRVAHSTLRSLRRLLVIANAAPISSIIVTRMMEAIRSSETSVHIRATRRNIPEDGVLKINTAFKQILITLIISLYRRFTVRHALETILTLKHLERNFRTRLEC